MPPSQTRCPPGEKHGFLPVGRPALCLLSEPKSGWPSRHVSVLVSGAALLLPSVVMPSATWLIPRGVRGQSTARRAIMGRVGLAPPPTTSCRHAGLRRSSSTAGRARGSPGHVRAELGCGPVGHVPRSLRPGKGLTSGGPCFLASRPQVQHHSRDAPRFTAPPVLPCPQQVRLGH